MNNTCAKCGKEITSLLRSFIPGVGAVCFICSCEKDLVILRNQKQRSKKQSLKKWEQEHRLKWDKLAPEDMREKVAEYCNNDVIATETVWNATQGDKKEENSYED